MEQLDIKISSDQPLVQQLKAQIRALVALGEVQPGAQLPTVKELSGYLRINRNTVAAAYQQLEQDGFVESLVGRGTFVADSQAVRRERQKRELFDLAERSLGKAYDLGFDPQEFVETVSAAATRERAGSSQVRAVFIECTLGDADHFARQIEEHVGISTVAVELEEFQADEQLRFRLLRLSDLVVTTFFHVQEVRELAPEDAEVLALGVNLPFRMLMELGQLPAGTKIALICDEERCLQNLRKSVTNAGIEHLDIRFVTRLDRQGLEKAADEVDRLYGCRPSMELLGERGLLKVASVGLFEQILDRSGLDMVREQVERIRNNDSP